jgi:osmoprotectant transport system ATP-binding protein
LIKVTRRYQGHIAVDDVSLDFAAGTVTAVIGSSGSGKSTLLRLLLGLEWADAGRVVVDGDSLTFARRLAVRRRIGTVIQEGGLFPHLTARDNLTLLPRHLGWSAARINDRAMELARLVQLSPEILKRYPSELSGGQRQRIAIMRALMTDPPALLLDEPLGALDPVVRHELQDELKTLFALLGKTVLLVTHDLPEAAFLAPRLVLMQNGRVVQDGSIDDFVTRPANDFVQRFVAAQRRLPEPQS